MPSALQAQACAPLGHFASTIFHNKNYSHQKPSGHRETWEECARRVTHSVIVKDLDATLSSGRGSLAERVNKRVASRQFIPGGRYLYSAGRRYQQYNNCFLLRAYDSREGWGELLDKVANCLMVGGGIGVVYSSIREEGAPVGGLGGTCSGPVSLAKIVNEAGRNMMQGGSRRSAIWAGLSWKHPDVFKFIESKDYSADIKKAKEANFNFPAPLDMTNISVTLDSDFFCAYHNAGHPLHERAQGVYWSTVRGMMRDGEPGFSIDLEGKEDEDLRNACCESVSRDDGDVCNLGSLNMARFSRLEDFAEAVEEGTAFLLCGTLVSELPMGYMLKVRAKNRRIGLGLMGVHEWLLKRGHRYGRCDELDDWLAAYASSTSHAWRYADALGVSRPVATRSIAPTGTISIIAETTSGIEPIYAVAYKRRYLEGKTWKAQLKVDEAARRIVDSGVDPELVEDAVTLAEDVERRIHFQAHVQQFVDQAISSTINLPPWGSTNNCEGTLRRFGDTLYKYLPQIRGVTAYPDGSRGGQPLTRVPYSFAVRQEGVEFIDNSEEGCKSGVCGT